MNICEEKIHKLCFQSLNLHLEPQYPGHKILYYSALHSILCYAMVICLPSPCTIAHHTNPPHPRARQNGDHGDRWSRKVIIFDGKFYLSFMRFCLLFDGKRVSVTETNILLLTICMILTMIRISISKTKYIWFHFPDFKDFALFVANFVVVIYAFSRKV